MKTLSSAQPKKRTQLNSALSFLRNLSPIVPIRAYIQVKSPNQQRGEIIAACEFSSWVSHLIAIVIFLFMTQVVKLSVANLFVASGLAAALAGVVILLSYENPCNSTTTKKLK
jgi:sugar phosphate permease